MKNLVYDSLYKFLVSLGIILIVFPIVVFVFLYNTEPVLISQEEYNLLSETSKNALSLKDFLTYTILKLPSWVFFAPILLGIIVLGVGLVWWGKTQKKLDEKLNQEVEKAKLESRFQEMTNQEKAEKIRSKVEVTNPELVPEEYKNSKNGQMGGTLHYLDENAHDESREKEDQENKEQFVQFYKAVNDYSYIEDLAYMYLKKKHASDYDGFRRDIRINNISFDFFGISKNSDLACDVMYLKENDIDERRLMRFIEKVRDAAEQYRKTSTRDLEVLLLIVTDKKLSPKQASTIFDVLTHNYSGPNAGMHVILQDIDSLKTYVDD